MLKRVRRRIRRGTRKGDPTPANARELDAMPAGTYCCLACRLLQEPTTSCLHCGAAMVAPIPLVRDLLRYRDMRLAAERDLGMITALIAVGSVPFPVLTPFALISLAALAVRVPLRRRRARIEAQQDVSPVMPAAALPPPGAVTRVGVVRPLYGCAVGSFLDQKPMVVEDVALASTGALGGTLFRATRSAPFLLELDGDDAEAQAGPVVVTGVVRWLPGAAIGMRRVRVQRSDGVLARLGLPEDLRVEAELVVDGVSPDSAARVDVSGVIVEEHVPELAMFREGATVRVMRGEPGKPVLIARATRGGAGGGGGVVKMF
jgi:hypothetical protein